MSIIKTSKPIARVVLGIALFVGLMTLPGFVDGQTRGQPLPQRLVVSFISICCGIDQAAKKKFDTFIKQYERSARKRLRKAETHWGREGEIDVCLQLSELSRSQQKAFVSKVRALVRKSKLVHVKENEACQTGR